MPSYLVTGGAGFIGSHLATELVQRGHTVRVVDNLSTGKWRNLEHLPGVECIEGDLADIDASVNLLVAARDAGVKRLVYAGSSAAYGDLPPLPKREDMSTDPLS